jgi:hypothetical protein
MVVDKLLYISVLIDVDSTYTAIQCIHERRNQCLLFSSTLAQQPFFDMH